MIFTLWKNIIGFIELMHLILGYDEWTIAEYFRKQGATIGDNCRISIRKLGDEPYLVKLGNNVFVARDVVFHTHEGGVWLLRKEIPDMDVYGQIEIGDNCLIGANSHLLPNITIGGDSIVGANSVVITDVPPNSVVMGVPARVIGSSDKYKEKCIDKWQAQKMPDHQKIEVVHDWQTNNNYQKYRKILREHLLSFFNKQGMRR